jgi:hypothetical protein
MSWMPDVMMIVIVGCGPRLPLFPSRGELARVLAADERRCCLREWLARVLDPRSRLGRWHPLEFVLAVAVCAFTGAGHDSPVAIAEWAAGCSQGAHRACCGTGHRGEPLQGLRRGG